MTKPTDAQIEAVAKALYQHDYGPNYSWDKDATGFEKDIYRARTAAALTAAARVIAAEREACAQVAEEFFSETGWDRANEVAAAIRARKS